MPMDPDEIERLIKDALPDAQVTIEDLAGDGDHYAAHVVSASPCAKPRTLVAGQAGDRFCLDIKQLGGRRHLPMVSLQRAA